VSTALKSDRIMEGYEGLGRFAESAYALRCADATDGAIAVDVLGGVEPYSYGWSDGSALDSVTVGAGQHSVLVTDANGCTSQTLVTVVAPAAIEAQAAIKAEARAVKKGDWVVIQSLGSAWAGSWSRPVRRCLSVARLLAAGQRLRCRA
jgi:hypothetical protein